MLPDDLVREGQHVMTVCNSCRYCEGYCPVFQAMEDRLTFAKGDLTYLANLCHNCGECLYACQYAPPHEFGINVPRTLAQVRLASYEEFCWPRFLGGAFRRQPLFTALSLAGSFVILLAAARAFGGEPAAGDFYQVLPHRVMVTLYSAVALLVIGALVGARAQARRAIGWTPNIATALPPSTTARREPIAGYEGHGAPPATPATLIRGIRDAVTLRHLHGAGADCTDHEEARGPWRRWFHHCTFYGFGLCFASTTVAAIYHIGFGWRAPYALTSLPVVLGTSGGLALLVGPAGLLALRQRRDPALGVPAQSGLDLSFIAMLFLTSGSGLALLAFREAAAMPGLLIVHLAFVLALFVMLPFGKFVHGIHRTAALMMFARESRQH
jgi:citrate/tricarballylate utilization protein